MTHALKRIALGGLLAIAAATPAYAQSTSTEFTLNGLTREGTVITNTATATYTDENGNTYDQLTASASVTVGFLASLEIMALETMAPAGPSADNELVLTVTNNGNGDDFLALSTTYPAGITNVRYVVDGVTYTTLEDLNAALAGMAIEADGTLVVTVLYDVEDGYGGMPLDFEATITSTRAPTQDGGSDTATTIITPVRTDGVNVSPDGASIERLPSNGTQYTATFTVTNTGNAPETFNLVASVDGTEVTIVSVHGAPGTTSSILLAQGASGTVTVVYTVADDADAGTMVSITLTATSQSDALVTDDGDITVVVIRPAVTMTKEAYQDGRAVLFDTAEVLPGEFIEYRITVTNGGTTAATNVVIVDPLPAQVTFISYQADVLSGWSFVESGTGGNTITATLNGELPAATSRHIWIRAQVK
jgi:uncharacterized repeat protein (TIGR01451 family)